MQKLSKVDTLKLKIIEDITLALDWFSNPNPSIKQKIKPELVINK